VGRGSRGVGTKVARTDSRIFHVIVSISAKDTADDEADWGTELWPGDGRGLDDEDRAWRVLQNPVGGAPKEQSPKSAVTVRADHD
jgi:hypothetical protein